MSLSIETEQSNRPTKFADLAKYRGAGVSIPRDLDLAAKRFTPVSRDTTRGWSWSEGLRQGCSTGRQRAAGIGPGGREERGRGCKRGRGARRREKGKRDCARIID